MLSKRWVLLGSAVVLLACSTSIETPFAEPVAFDAIRYCSTVDRSAPLAVPDEITTTLEAERADEEALAMAVLTDAVIRIAHASENAEACQSVIRAGDATFMSVLKAQQTALSDKGGFDPAKDADILAVQTDITRLWREDQAARAAYINLQTEDREGADYWAQRRSVAHTMRIDAESKTAIEAYAKQYGWIDTKRFDGPVSAHAWILVQHADDHPDFQSEILAKMEPYVKRGETSQKNYAYLWDRVAVNTGRKQRYGTQPTWECDEAGKMELRPLEAPETVNDRRASVGLNTVEEGLAEMERQVCR